MTVAGHGGDALTGQGAAGGDRGGATTPPPHPGSRWGQLAIRVAGALVAYTGGLLVGILTLVTVPWRLEAWFGQVRFPVAVVVALAGLLALLWYAPRAIGSRWGVLAPVAGWFTVTAAALTTTREGDYLLVADDWVAALALFAGTVVAIVGPVLAVASRR